MHEPLAQHARAETMPTEMKKKSNMRSLFSFFRSSRPSPRSEKENFLDRSTTTPSRPSSSLPSEDPLVAGQDNSSVASLPSYVYGNHASSTTSLPARGSSPSSSSSSASSLEFTSDASTTVTTPSTSSLSVVMKGWDSVSSTPADELVGEPAQLSRPKPTKRSSWTVPPSDNYRRQTSPSLLSVMTVAGSSSLYAPPSPPPLPVLHERRNSFQPKRRNSLGRLLTFGGHQSDPEPRRSPDSDSDSDVPSPSTMSYPIPSSRAMLSPPATGPSRAKSFKRKAGEKGRADLEKPAAYSKLERIEHESILGADPAGYGFYLYPKPKPSPKKDMSGRYGTVEFAIGSDSPKVDSGRPANYGRRTSYRELKGKTYRRNMATKEIIVEEEGDDGCETETPPVGKPPRRHSMAPPVRGNQWRQPRLDATTPCGGSLGDYAPSQPAGCAVDPTHHHSRPRSLQNSWEGLNRWESLNDPENAHSLEGQRDEEEERMMRRLKEEAMRIANGSGVPISRQMAGDKLGGGSQIPVLRVERVEA